jgi:hypothetical protein
VSREVPQGPRAQIAWMLAALILLGGLGGYLYGLIGHGHA